MKALWRASRNRTAILFLFSYLLVMAVPLAVSVGYYYPSMRAMLIANAKERAKNAVTQPLKGLEEQLTNIISMPNFIFENKRVIFRNIMEDPLSRKQAKEEIEQMIKTNTFISHVFLYMRDEAYFIGANSNSFYIEDMRRYSGLYQISFSGWSTDELKAILDTTDQMRIEPAARSMIGGGAFEEMLLFIAPVPNGRYAVATAIICVPTKNLLSYIDASLAEEGPFLIFDDAGTLIYSTAPIAQRDHGALIDAVGNEKAGTAELSLTSGTSMVTWASSPRYGWRTMQVLPLNSILGTAAALQRTTTLWMIATITACFLLILLAMKLNYMPIKRLASLATGDAGEPPSNDFSAIQQLITALTRENDRLGERLNMAEPQAREALISRLLSGGTAETRDAMSRAELFDIDLGGAAFCVWLADFGEARSAEDVCANLNEADAEALRLIAAQVELHHRVVLLLRVEEDGSGQAALRALLKGAKHIACGLCVRDAEQLGASYSSACAAMDYLHMKNDGQREIRYDDLPERVFNPRSYPLEVMQSLETAISHANEERFIELVAQLEHLIALDGAPPYFTRSVYFNAVNLLIGGLTKYLGAENSVVREIGMRSMLNHYTVREMVGILQATANQLSRLMRENAQKQTPMTEALNYIDQHIASSTLSLQAVADHVRLSPSAFSRSFKENVGRNFKEYVDAVRVLKAKKLLQETELSIERIATSVGYDTLTSFYRMFKKHTGAAPGEYRQALKRPQ